MVSVTWMPMVLMLYGQKGNLTLPQPVAFQANLEEDISGLKDNKPIVIKNAVVNVGDCYDRATGVFRAPEAGIYMFWANGMVMDRKSLQLLLNVNGELRAKGYTPFHKPFGVASITSVLSLEKGDNVYLTKGSSKRIRGNGYTNFGGVALHYRIPKQATGYPKTVVKVKNAEEAS